MKETYNLAFWGTGRIAATVIDTISHIDRLKKYACASRSIEKSNTFAEKYNVEKALSFEELLLDANVDLIYISTPTKLHYEHIKKCLLAGKNVICEKPMVETEEEAIELVQIAKNKQCLLIDGLWTMYMPIIGTLEEAIKQIGLIKYASAGLGYPSINRSATGITSTYELWDYEIYPLSIMHALFGPPDKIVSRTKIQYSMPVKNVSFLMYRGRKCRIFSSLKRRGTYCFFALGTKGLILCRKYWMGKYPVFVWKYPFSIKKHVMTHKYSGYEYEFEAAIDCLDHTEIQSEVYPLKRTIAIMKSKKSMYE